MNEKVKIEEKKPNFKNIKQIKDILLDFSAIDMSLIPNTSGFFVHSVKNKIHNKIINLKNPGDDAIHNTILKLAGAYSLRCRSLPINTLPNIFKRLQWLEYVLDVSFPYPLKQMIKEWEDIQRFLLDNQNKNNWNYIPNGDLTFGSLNISDQESSWLSSRNCSEGRLIDLMFFMKFANNPNFHQCNKVAVYLEKVNKQIKENVKHIGYEIFDFCSWHFTCYPAYKSEVALVTAHPYLKELSEKHNIPAKDIYFLFAQHKLYLWEGICLGKAFNKKGKNEMSLSINSNKNVDGIKKIQYHLDRINLTDHYPEEKFNTDANGIEESLYSDLLNHNPIHFYGELFPFDSVETADVMMNLITHLIETKRITVDTP